ncbi:MAG: undecaprenyl-diphosphate phosphatase, partial [Patescibacteria group bacterium]
MTLLQAIVLGLVQGITEFLPISSSGHLVMVPQFFGWEDQGAVFDALLHG